MASAGAKREDPVEQTAVRQPAQQAADAENGVEARVGLGV
jgi:hypothetical protein